MKKRISPHKVWQYRKANYDQLREELHQYQQEFNKLDASTSTDHMWLAFKTDENVYTSKNGKGKQKQQAMDQ